MYFASRLQAGRMLAGQLAPKYRTEKCAVLALGDGGVMVGAQIAMALHCVLTMLMVEEINLPRETMAIGGVAQDGTFTYNHGYSEGEIDEMVSEYYGYIEQEKLAHLQNMHRLIGAHGLTDPKLLKDHNVIVVSDGLKSSFPLDMARQFLKPIETKRLIIATPLASVQAVDWMHIQADEIYCLSVLTDYMDTNHYYDKQDVPEHDTVIKTVEQIIRKWH